MRRQHLFCGIALAVLLVTLLLGGYFDLGGSRDFTMAFAGFKDHDGKMEALFWTTNGSVAAVNQLQELSRKIGASWTNETCGPVCVHEQIPYDDSFDVFDAPHAVKLIGISVAETHSPLRVVIRCQERSPGLAGVRDQVQNYYYNRIKGHSVVILRGRDYCVTNEVPGKLPPSATRALQAPNNSMQPMRASRSRCCQQVAQWRLVLTADAERWTVL